MVHMDVDGKWKPIGGPGEIVQMDEAFIGKVNYNQGHPVQGLVNLGGIEIDINAPNAKDGSFCDNCP